MAKNAKLTIYHIRSIQAQVKYSILLLQQLEKITLLSESGGRITQMSSLLIPERRYSEGSAQD